MKKLLFLLLPLMLVMTSCALIFNGQTKNVSVKSMTQDSEIYVDGSYVGTDAISVALTRENNHTVIVKKEGYNTETVGINSRAQIGWVIFDVFFNWFALLTDASTGAWCGFDRTIIVVNLKPKK